MSQAVFDVVNGDWEDTLDVLHANEDEEQHHDSPFEVCPVNLDLFEEIISEELVTPVAAPEPQVVSQVTGVNDAETEQPAVPSKKRSIQDAGISHDHGDEFCLKVSCTESEGSEDSSLAERFYPSASNLRSPRENDKQAKMQSDLMLKVYGSSECTSVKKQDTENSSAVEPSRFCHICTKSAKSSRQAVCCNIKNGTCRKVICEKCFEDNNWNFQLAIESSSDWFCPHCAGVCPPKAQCNVYKRTNQRMRARRMIEKAESKKVTEVSCTSALNTPAKAPISPTSPVTPRTPAVVPAPVPFNGMPMPVNHAQQPSMGGVPFHMLPYLYPQLAAQIAATMFQPQGNRQF
eukprot:CAMPEP_0185846734 /NCGR_PEP_ID=MMETSP1354-20130828/2271_1 /TAXON_ID=708628 /ORGANISM="Erythrolobus madagascarensis, Strain CCMP3276" /LENGTH=346 /DNA_ID=CAMNT_0028546935 /DNA_START=153 /DNA_END=1193 /DNA_ORIENTATION=-